MLAVLTVFVFVHCNIETNFVNFETLCNYKQSPILIEFCFVLINPTENT